MADTVQQPPYGYFYDVKTSGGAVFLAILFLAFTLGHIWKVINVREWYGLAIVTGGICKPSTNTT